ncbi:copper resistance protein CopC [Leucobacter coleopterorum]|uniref:Copper resistance protein CopC n=1 Tax=Leucobacter coleopterorum TaxID=2714933 RepID=A0ABX6K0P7_9MICO|nr:copper resistance CopC family protein [Leucobacter coleopterorum]QIM18784.1 copper resistance protein CopC [Leucobacter coleopterorum]
MASPALAHDELVGTDLLANESDGTVQALELSFSNSIITVGTEIIVTGPADASASDGKPSVAGPVVTQRLLPDLAEGTYTVAWRVVSSDGHPIEGGFVFFVESDGSADPDQIASIEDDPRSGDDEGSSASEATSDEAGSSGMPLG